MSDPVLILTGFMGSGKTTVGTRVAARLGVRFIDLDAEIVAAAGCSINDIFARDGEEGFRTLESLQLQRILAETAGCVIATGGGAVIAGQNRAMMRSKGVVVNLKVSLEHVLSRLSRNNNRPLLAGENVVERAAALMNEREHFYADSDIRIDTDGKSVEDIATEILRRLEGFSE
jgi:shikimate kinase